MRHGVFVPAPVVRAAAGALLVMLVVISVSEGPALRRFYRLKTM